jgi:hypothetical protein
LPPRPHKGHRKVSNYTHIKRTPKSRCAIFSFNGFEDTTKIPTRSRGTCLGDLAGDRNFNLKKTAACAAQCASRLAFRSCAGIWYMDQGTHCPLSLSLSMYGVYNVAVAGIIHHSLTHHSHSHQPLVHVRQMCFMPACAFQFHELFFLFEVRKCLFLCLSIASSVGYVTIVIHTVPRNHRNTSQK